MSSLHASPNVLAASGTNASEYLKQRSSTVSQPLIIRLSEAPEVDDRDFALYDVLLSIPNSNIGWSVRRRFNDFVTLKQELEPMLTDREKDMFPRKHLFHSSKAKSVVEERLELLPSWLIAISQIPAVVSSASFKRFLNISQHESAIRSHMGSSFDGSDKTADIAYSLDPVHNAAVADTSRGAIAVSQGQTFDVDVKGLHTGDVKEDRAVAQAQVDVRIPTVNVDDAIDKIHKAKQELDETKQTEQHARELHTRAMEHGDAALRAKSEAEEAEARARDLFKQADALNAGASLADREARELEEAAKMKREQSKQNKSAAHERAAEAARAGKLAEERERQYESERLMLEKLRAEAEQAHRTALEHQAIAMRNHEIAAEELVMAEQALQQAADVETKRQVAEAAASAARAKKHVTQAALLKAEEEASIALAHFAAREEAEAESMMRMAQEQMQRARERKQELMVKASEDRNAASVETKAAACDSALLDARTKAADVIRSHANTAENIMADVEARDSVMHSASRRLSGGATTSNSSTVLVAESIVKPVTKLVDGVGSAETVPVEVSTSTSNGSQRL